MQDSEIRKTEDLVFWTAQYCTAARESFVFKRDPNSQDQILVNFIGSSGWTPRRGEIVEVTYFFGRDGIYHGVKMLPTDAVWCGR